MRVSEKIRQHLEDEERLDALYEFAATASVGDTVVVEAWGVPGEEETLSRIEGKIWADGGALFVGPVKLMRFGGEQVISVLIIKSARVILAAETGS